jgi:hypothetical protein
MKNGRGRGDMGVCIYVLIDLELGIDVSIWMDWYRGIDRSINQSMDQSIQINRLTTANSN